MSSILPTVYNVGEVDRVYHELTVWSRGIIMDKEARDVSSCIAAAARTLGYYADNVSDYVDDPDRTNCLVRRYARFGDSPIVDRFVYENPHPDWVVLVEETIIKAVNFLRGTPDRGGVVVVNSVRDPHYLLKFLPGEMQSKIAKFVVVDAVGLAEQRGRSPWMFVRNLSELALDRMSTEGAEERLAIGMGIAAPLIGALTAATGVLPVEAVADQVADTDAMLRGAARHTVVDFTAADGPVTHAADGTVTGAADGTVTGAADGTVTGAADGTVTGAADGTLTGGAAEQAPASHTC